MKQPTTDILVDRKDLQEGHRVVALNGKAYRIVWIRQFESVTLFRTVGTGHASATRLEPGVSVKVRVQA